MGFDSAGSEVGERPVHSLRQRAGRKPVSDEAAVEDNTRISGERAPSSRNARSSVASDCWGSAGTLPAIPTRTLSASLTAAAFGNAKDTSGSKTTMFELALYRSKYLPLTPPLKSYSGRISSTASL